MTQEALKLAQDKIDNDDLTIAYQSGYYDGKKAAQPAQEPVAWLSKGGKGIWFHEPDASLNATPLYTAPPQPAQKPVAWLDPEWGDKICPEVGYEVTITDDHPRDLGWTPLYPHPPQPSQEPQKSRDEFIKRLRTLCGLFGGEHPEQSLAQREFIRDFAPPPQEKNNE